MSKGVGKGEAGAEAPPQILSSCYYVYKQLPQMDVQNVLLQKKKAREEKNSFQVISSVTHTKTKA